MRRLAAAALLGLAVLTEVLETIFHPSRYNSYLDETRCKLIGHDPETEAERITSKNYCRRCYAEIK